MGHEMNNKDKLYHAKSGHMQNINIYIYISCLTLMKHNNTNIHIQIFIKITHLEYITLTMSR